MILWTIQTEEVYEQLMGSGIYRTDESLSLAGDIEDFKLQYDWLADKMRFLVGNPPEGVVYPVWAWHTWEGHRKRRDMRRRGYGTKGLKLIQMEIDIPDDKVMLTDFDLWVAALHGCNIDIETEADADEDKNNLFTAVKTERYQEYKEMIIKSWDRCIGCDQKYNDLFMYKGGRSIQATFWELKSDQVKKVWHFTCKG